MSQYTPDSWVVVELGAPATRHRRVLASWSGGFSGSDSWRLSSGITDIEEDGEVLKIVNHSGSVYYCHKSSQKLTNMTAGVLQNLSNNKTLDPKLVKI